MNTYYQEKLKGPKTSASESFDRFTPPERDVVRLESLSGISARSNLCATFTARVRDIGENLPLPPYLGTPDTACFFASRMDALLKDTALGEAGNIRNLGIEQFDALLFASAMFRHGFLSPSQHVRLARDFLDAVASGIPMVKEPLVSTVGVEMEFFGLHSDHIRFLDNAIDFHDDEWLRATDQTITPDDGTEGIELISPIMNSNNIHRLSLHALLLSMLGAKTNTSCALHVHEGIRDTFSHPYNKDPNPAVMKFQTEIMKQILVNYVSVENDLSFLDKTNVKNYYDPKTKPFYLSDLEPFSIGTVLEKACYEDFITGNSIVQPHGRENGKINFLSMLTYGTVEFRQHPGTVSPAEIAAWITFLNALTRQATDIVKINGKAHLPDAGEYEYLRDRVIELAQTHRQAIAAPCPSA